MCETLSEVMLGTCRVPPTDFDLDDKGRSMESDYWPSPRKNSHLGTILFLSIGPLVAQIIISIPIGEENERGCNITYAIRLKV